MFLYGIIRNINRIIIRSENEAYFELKCGLELKELSFRDILLNRKTPCRREFSETGIGALYCQMVNIMVYAV